MNIKLISWDEWKQGAVTNSLPLAELPFSIEVAEKKINLNLHRYRRDGMGEFIGGALHIGDSEILLQGSIDTKEIGAIVEMRGTEREPKKVLNSICSILDISLEQLAWVSNYLDGPKYKVVRLDDNDNEIEMERFFDLHAAERYAKIFEDRGHKQTYSVKRAI